jgi:hypothetical protein
MTLTFLELKERLARWDEIDLIERLGITSAEIVDKFEDLIDEKFDTLMHDEDDDEFNEEAVSD